MSRYVLLRTLKMTKEHEPVSSSSKHYVAVTISMVLWNIDKGHVPVLLSSSPLTHHGPVCGFIARNNLARSSLVSLASTGLWIWSATLTSHPDAGFETDRCACLVACFYNIPHTCQCQLNQLYTLIMDLGIVLMSKDKTRTETTSVRVHSVGWVMSRQSEYKRCNKSNIAYDINNQLENVGNYVVQS